MKIISKHNKLESAFSYQLRLTGSDMLVCSNINQSFGEKVVAFLNLSCRDEKSSYCFELVSDSHKAFIYTSYMDFTTDLSKKLMEILVVDIARLNLSVKNLEDKLEEIKNDLQRLENLIKIQ